MKVLVLAAHPDDEILGCGGTVAKHSSQGDTVRMVLMGKGVSSRREDYHTSEDTKQRLETATAKAAEILGVSSSKSYDLPDNMADTVALLDIVKKVEQELSGFQPDIIYTHHAGDVNIDHQRLHEAVITACRPVPGNLVRQLYFFEIASSTEWQSASQNKPFVPNHFVDISSTLDKKLSALEAYHLEMRDWPHARSLKSLEALARWRGATIGVEAAEAFAVGRTLA